MTDASIKHVIIDPSNSGDLPTQAWPIPSSPTSISKAQLKAAQRVVEAEIQRTKARFSTPRDNQGAQGRTDDSAAQAAAMQ